MQIHRASPVPSQKRVQALRNSLLAIKTAAEAKTAATFEQNAAHKKHQPCSRMPFSSPERSTPVTPKGTPRSESQGSSRKGLKGGYDGAVWGRSGPLSSVWQRVSSESHLLQQQPVAGAHLHDSAVLTAMLQCHPTLLPPSPPPAGGAAAAVC